MYDDIINLPHHVSATRPQMSMIDRAAQFSPFAALTGYDAAIKETGRLTDEKIELDEAALNILNMKFQILVDSLEDEPEVTFKALDNLCRDIYGESVDNKLGVTLYLEDMDKKAHQGSINVSGWVSDYNRLKSARNIRNELAHSRNSMTVDICSQEDIDFVRSFRAKILNQTDPLAMLRKQSAQPRLSTTTQPKRQHQPIYTTPAKKPVGCFGIVAAFLIVVACIIAFLL